MSTDMQAPGRTSIDFDGLDVREMFSHYVLYGTAAICEAAGIPDVRLSWTAGMCPVPRLSGSGLDGSVVGELVRTHARRMAEGRSWLQEALPADPRRGLFSPRVATLPDIPEHWETLHAARHAVEDALPLEGDWLSLALIGALGEPAYWRRNPQGQRLQDDGASRLDMQPRNQGSEFVGSRLRPLARAVAARRADQVTAGLLGDTVVDDMGKGAADSRTATNLRPLGPTDSVQGWVALWGLTATAVAHRTSRQSATATHVPGRGDERHGCFVLPIWQGDWRPAKLRAVLASEEFTQAAQTTVGGSSGPVTDLGARRRLRRSRGVGALVTFPVAEFGSKSAPERRAMRGTVTALPDE